MAYITVPELRSHLIGSPLSDSALQDIIDEISETIDSRFGPVGVDVLEQFRPGRGDGPLILRRRPATITTITEWLDSVGSSTRTLDPADFLVRGYLVQRRQSGPNPATGWAWYGADVLYRPEDDSRRRMMAIVDVAKIEVGHSAFQSERIGDYSYAKGGGSNGKASSTDSQRDEILRKRLGRRLVFA